MTKKDYIIISDVINSQHYALRDQSCDKAIEQTLTELSHVLAGRMAQDNPRFDKEKFLKACGVNN